MHTLLPWSMLTAMKMCDFQWFNFTTVNCNVSTAKSETSFLISKVDGHKNKIKKVKFKFS